MKRKFKYFNLFILVVLANSNLVAQITFDWAFNHLKQDSNAVLVKFQLADFNFDNSDELVSIYRTDSSWYVNVDTKNHKRIFSYSQIDSSFTLKKALLFNNLDSSDTWFLALVYTRMKNFFESEVKFEVVDLSNKKQIDDIIFSPRENSGDLENYYYPSSIEIIKLNSQIIFYLGLNSSYSGHGPGVDYSGIEPYLVHIKYNETLKLENIYNDYSEIILSSKLIYGSESYSGGPPLNLAPSSTNSYKFNIAAVNIDSTNGNLIIDNNFEYNDNGSHTLLSSKDISNKIFGTTFYKYRYPIGPIFFSFKPQSYEIAWEDSVTNLDVLYGGYKGSNLFTNNDEPLIIYFNSKDYEVRDRLTGNILANGSTSFGPIGIIQDDDLNTYCYSFNSRTYTFYRINADEISSVDNSAISNDYNLSQNYPNPFNPSTVISYLIPESGNVSLKIFDVLGREVTTLVNKVQSAGNYKIKFNSNSLSSGIYFYKLETETFTKTKKMVLIR